MVKITLTEENYAPQAEAGAGRYYCRVLPEWNQDHTLVDVVEEVVEHEPTEEDRKDIIARWTAKQKQHKINDILKYDSSPEVNGFYLNDELVWLSKDMRVGLVNSTTIEKNAGIQETTLWFEGHSFVIGVDDVLEMLSALEIYAKQCYNKTQEHIAEVNDLEDVKDVDDYDYTVGYPEKLHFNV
jgi:hypothetical protein